MGCGQRGTRGAMTKSENKYAISQGVVLSPQSGAKRYPSSKAHVRCREVKNTVSFVNGSQTKSLAP